MTRTTFDLDDATHLRVINLAFQCSITRGSQSMRGAPGEHVFEILGRWLAIHYPHLLVSKVQQSGALSWTCQADTGLGITFTVEL